MTLTVDNEIVLCDIQPKFDDDDSSKIDVATSISPSLILREIIPDYHIGSRAIEISDFSGLDEKAQMEVSVDLDKKDIGKLVSSDFFDRQIVDVKIENLPLRASDDNVATRWISELRRYWWKDEFVDVEQARIDQEYWSEKLLGSKRNNLILEGDELLKELQDSDAFWGVASMMDLMPDSAIRVPFYISGQDDYNDIITRMVFSDIDYKNLKRVVLVDSYPGKYAETVLRKWMKNDDVEIVFLVNDKRYNESNNKLERSNLKTNSRIEINHMEKKKAHSRFIIFIDKDDKLTIWNVDNSMSSFYVKNDKVMTEASMEFTPKSQLNDKDLEKIVRGL